MNKLPAEDLFIKAAADLSGSDPGGLDAREALHILQEYGREPMGDLYRQLTDAAAAELFSDPNYTAEWEEIAAEWDGDYPDTIAFTVQRDLSPAIKEKARAMYDDLPQDDPQRDELGKILKEPALSPEIQEAVESVNRVTNNIAKKILQPFAVDVKGIQDTIAPVLATARGVSEAILATQEAIRAAMAPIDFGELFLQYGAALETLSKIKESSPLFVLFDEMQGDLAPYIEEELKNPQYGGKTIEELIDEAEETDDGLFSEESLLMQAVNAARAAKTIAAQSAGRALRRQTRENAAQVGAIMELRNDGTLPVFSEKTLWNAFAPGRISQMGKLAPDAINERTGRVEKIELEEDDIVPVTAANISYKAFLLLNAIIANSVENYRETMVSGGEICFYVKGVLDQLEVDARIHGDPQQIELDTQQIELDREQDRHTRTRKTTGALYLEEQLKPLLLFVGTVPNGSRYSVLNYVGYDIESDTMTIRSPYLFQLWRAAQLAYSTRKKGKEQRIADGKKPLKADLKPLELNTLFKRSAYKEDDTVLEIATFITNVLLNAGKGAHKTKIKYRTLINNCPRLRERLKELDELPKDAKGKRGNKINKTAQYNSALRKIARAYTLIMTPDKCDALKHFEFIEFMPTKEKGGRREFVPPTKSALDGEIYINWRRIDPDDD